MKSVSKSVMLLSMALFLFGAGVKAADVDVRDLEDEVESLLTRIDEMIEVLVLGDLSSIDQVYDKLVEAQNILAKFPQGAMQASRDDMAWKYAELANYYARMGNFVRAKEIVESVESSKLQWKKLQAGANTLKAINFSQRSDELLSMKIEYFRSLVDKDESEKAQAMLDEIRGIKDIGSILNAGDSQLLLLQWFNLGRLYAEQGNLVKAQDLFTQGKAQIKTFKNLSGTIRTQLANMFEEKLSKEEPAKPVGPADAAEYPAMKDRKKAQELLEEAEAMKAGKKVFTDEDIKAIEEKYNEATALFSFNDNAKIKGLDFLVAAYKGKIDLYLKGERFAQLILYAQSSDGWVKSSAKSLRGNIGLSDNIPGSYDASAAFAEYEKLPNDFKTAIEKARGELRQKFAQIKPTLTSEDISVLQAAIHKFNDLVESPGYVEYLGNAIEGVVESYLKANLKVLDSYLKTKNLVALKAFDGWEIVDEIAGTDIALKEWADVKTDAKTELSKRYSAFKNLEQAQKTTEPGTPAGQAGDAAALRDALQNLANALNGVQGNL